MATAPQHISLYEPSPEEMGERLEALLPIAKLKKGESADGFATLMGVDASQVTRWLKGEGLLPALLRICNALTGRGRLSLNAFEIRDYIECQVGEDDLPLRIGPVGGGGALESPDHRLDEGGYDTRDDHSIAA